MNNLGRIKRKKYGAGAAHFLKIQISYGDN